MSLPSFSVGPPPQPQDTRVWEWITLFWAWVKSLWSSLFVDLADLEARVAALEADMEELMNGISELNEKIADLLTEARITNHYLYELPKQLNDGTVQPVTDEPDAFRKDSNVFNQ